MPPVKEEKGGAIRPTLFVGLGGTGKEVLLRLRRKFYEDFGEPGLPCMAYLWLDTDIHGAGAQGEALDVIYDSVKFTVKDSISLMDGEVGLAMADVFGSLGRNEHIHRWLYPEVERYGRKISDGAGNVRSVGRLALFHKYKDVADRVNLIATKTLTEETLESTQLMLAGTTAQDFDFKHQAIVVFSVAGGTGGGTFLDLAFQLCQMKLFQHTAAICVLPNVYFKTRMDEQASRSYANAYAALKELEYYTFCLDRAGEADKQAGGEQRKRGIAKFLVEWEKGKTQEISGPPLDVTYVLEPQSELGVGLESKPEFFRMAAESLYMDFMPGAFSAAKRSSYSNVVQYLNGAEGANARVDGMALTQEFSRRYASFGMSKIEIPIDALRGACAAQLGHDIVSHWTRTCTDPDMLGSVQHDLADLGLTLDGVSRRFDTGWRDNLTQAADSAVAGLRAKAGASTLADIEEARKALNEMEAQYLGTDTAKLNVDLNIPHRLKVKSPAVTEQLRAVMEQWLVRCLEEPERGLRGLLAEKTGYLARIQEQLQGTFTSDKSDCASRRDRAEKDAGPWQSERDRFLDELTEAVTNSKVGLLSERNFSVKLLADKLKDAELQYALAKTEAVLYSLCQQAVKDAVTYLVGRAARLPQFLTDLEAMAGPFLELKAARLRPGEDVLFIRIFDYDRDWPKFYTLGGKPVAANSEAKGFQAHKEFGGRSLSTLELADFRFRESVERLNRLLTDYCEDRFTKDFKSPDRAEQDVLKHPKFTERPLKDWVQRLTRASLPRVKRSEYLGGRQVRVKREAYLGISADADPEVLRSLSKEITDSMTAYLFPVSVLKSTRKSELFLYTVSYAFPLPSVPVVADSCHDAYYAFYRDLRENRQFGKLYYQIPLHLDKRWEGKFEDLVLYTEQDARVAKESLEALLFGSILKVVRRYDRDGMTVYGYSKVSVGRVAEVELGNRKEAMDTLMSDAGLRGRLLGIIGEREKNLSEKEQAAYSYILMYLSSLPSFSIGTPEHELLKAKHTAVMQSAGDVRIPEKGRDEAGLANWVRQQAGDVLDWPQGSDLPMLNKEAWEDRPGAK